MYLASNIAFGTFLQCISSVYVRTTCLAQHGCGGPLSKSSSKCLSEFSFKQIVLEEVQQHGFFGDGCHHIQGLVFALRLPRFTSQDFNH